MNVTPDLQENVYGKSAKSKSGCKLIPETTFKRGYNE